MNSAKGARKEPAVSGSPIQQLAGGHSPEINSDNAEHPEQQKKEWFDQRGRQSFEQDNGTTVQGKEIGGEVEVIRTQVEKLLNQSAPPIQCNPNDLSGAYGRLQKLKKGASEDLVRQIDALLWDIRLQIKKAEEREKLEGYLHRVKDDREWLQKILQRKLRGAQRQMVKVKLMNAYEYAVCVAEKPTQNGDLKHKLKEQVTGVLTMLVELAKQLFAKVLQQQRSSLNRIFNDLVRIQNDLRKQLQADPEQILDRVKYVETYDKKTERYASKTKQVIDVIIRKEHSIYPQNKQFEGELRKKVIQTNQLNKQMRKRLGIILSYQQTMRVQRDNLLLDNTQAGSDNNSENDNEEIE